jgi:hypothetical protein
MQKFDALLWSTHYLNGRSNLNPNVFKKGLTMILPSGKALGFKPIPKMKVPVLKPIKSEGYSEWTGLKTSATIAVGIAVGFKELPPAKTPAKKKGWLKRMLPG